MNADGDAPTRKGAGVAEESAVMSAFGPLRAHGRRRRASDHAQGQGSQLWLVTFTDIMALMLTFFVLLFSMSSPKSEQWAEMKTALQTQLKGAEDQRMQRGTEDAPNMDRVNFNRALDIGYLQALLKSTLAENAALSDVRLITQPDALVVSMPQDLLFEVGSADVKADGRRALYVLGGALSRIRNKIEVAGHADPRPLDVSSSPYASNWGLSAARAAAVAGILESVGYTRTITVHGYSSARYEDLSTLEDEDARMDLARRVDIIIRNDDGRRSNLFGE